MFLLLIYLASIADKALLALRWCLLGTFIILAILLVCFSAVKFADDEAKFSINLKPYITAWVVALVVYIALPSSKAVYILAGTAYMQELAKSESVQKVSSDIVEILKLKVKEARKELEKGIR